jgi:hypothetical protein
MLRRFLIWSSTSMTGHVALFQFTFAIPFAVLFIGLNYAEGTLTIGWAAWIAAVSAACGIIGGIVIWVAITMPRIKRR